MAEFIGLKDRRKANYYECLVRVINKSNFVHFKDKLVDIAKNANLRKVKRDHVIVWQGQEGKQ